MRFWEFSEDMQRDDDRDAQALAPRGKLWSSWKTWRECLEEQKVDTVYCGVQEKRELPTQEAKVDRHRESRAARLVRDGHGSLWKLCRMTQQ